MHCILNYAEPSYYNNGATMPIVVLGSNIDSTDDFSIISD